MSVRRAIAVAVVALALPSAAAAAPVYRGSAHGVTCVLTPSTLTITFGHGTDALLRRAARSPFTMQFLMWPPPADMKPWGWTTAWFAATTTVDVHKRQATLQIDEMPKSKAFLCGLHDPVPPAKGESKASDYTRNAYVLIRLTRVG